VLGVTQIFAWGSSYYLPAVLAKPIAADTGWSLSWVVGGLSLGLLVAGLVSPWVGRAIARSGGRPVLALSAGLLAAGLSALALAHSLPAFLIAWLLVGLGMGAGLYDPAFATLGRLYGHGGRSAITTLTLFGGFASTVCWPLSAFLDAHLGWRGACLVYAGFQLRSRCRHTCSSCRAKVRGARLCQRRRSRQRMRLRDLSRTEARSFFCWPPP